MRSGRPANRLQNGNSLLVSPVVDDFHHQIGIAGRQGIPEKIAGLQRKSFRRCACDLFDHMRQVKQHTFRARRGVEHCPQQVATPTANIADETEA